MRKELKKEGETRGFNTSLGTLEFSLMSYEIRFDFTINASLELSSMFPTMLTLTSVLSYKIKLKANTHR